MKKVLHLMILVALVIMIGMPSCTKPEKQIVGKWKIVYAKMAGDKDEEAEGEVWVFKDNGKFRGYLGPEEEAEVYCDWFIDGDELVLKGEDLEINESSYDYSYNEENVITLDIEQLDKKTLVVSGRWRYKYTLIEDGYITHQGSDSFKVEYELEAK